VQHLKTQPKPLESIRPDLPPALCRLVHSMLVKSPDRRCASAREIVREVRRLQLEYGGEELPEDLPGWDVLSGEFSTDPRIAATRHLGDLMKTLAMQQPKRRRWRLYAAGALAAFVVGGLVAWSAAVDRPLLAGAAETEQTIPSAASAARQYFIACNLGTEEAWKSVIRYHPDDLMYTPKAREQLALIYLVRRDSENALKIFDDLVNMGDGYKEYEAFAWAGRSVAYYINHQDEKSAQALNKLPRLFSDLKNPLMAQLVRSTINKQRVTLKKLISGEDWDNLEKMVETRPPESN
jgi:eukaryotic-like serine/threonine-protein kinase